MGIVQVIIDRTTAMVIEGVYEFDRPDGGVLVAPAGSSFPGTTVAGEWFWRTDLNRLYRRNDGDTAWEAVQATAVAHAPTHEPGGGDAMAVDAAAATGSLRTIGTSSTSACAGNDARLSDARPPTSHAASHKGDGGDAVAVATQTVAGLESAADKTKLDGMASGATNTPLSSTAPVSVTKAAAAAGSASEASRQDHKHDITTAVAAAQVPGDSAAEGAATSLARSDHKHGLPAYGTGSGTICQGNDSRLSDARTPTGSAGGDLSGSTYPNPTVTNSAITNTKLANMAQALFKGRAAGAGTGTPQDLTPAQATAILNAFTATLKGLTPASGGGTTNFLRADGTWATPSGGSTFGSNAQDAESLGTSTTTGSNQTKVTLATPSLPAGRYRIGWSCEAGLTSSIAQDFLVNVLLDGTTTLADVVLEPKDTGNRYAISGFAHVDLSAAAHTVLLRYGSQNSHTATIRNARLEIWRVS